MTSKDEQIRATIAEQASEWFVANDEAPLSAEESTALVAWLKASPIHVEEFLGVAAIARDLPTAGTDPESSLEALLARTRTAEEGRAQSFWFGVFAGVRDAWARRWQSAVITVTTIVIASAAALLWKFVRPIAPASPAAGTTALHFEARHGEQRTFRLADNSVLHLNTDSAVTVRYSQTERVVELTSGEAAFEVTHEPARAFRVLAGPAEVVDLGTQFDVRLTPDSTVVAVLVGRVAVKARTSGWGRRHALEPSPAAIRAAGC